MESKILERLDAMQQAIDKTKQAIDKTQTFVLLAAKTMLSIADVAALTGMSKAHIYRLTCTRAILYYKPHGKQIFFKRQDVETWMQQNRVDSVADAEAIAARYCVTGSAHNPARQ